MATTTIRVSPATRDRLARIGKRRGLSTPQLLEDLAVRAEEDDLVNGLNEDFAHLASEALEAHRAETAEWDRTSSDAAE